MELNCFQILLIAVIFLFLTCLKGVNVLIKNENPNICDTGGKRVNTEVVAVADITVTAVRNMFAAASAVGSFHIALIVAFPVRPRRLQMLLIFIC